MITSMLELPVDIYPLIMAQMNDSTRAKFMGVCKVFQAMVLDYEKPQWIAFLQTRQITVIGENPRPQAIAYIKDYCRYFFLTTKKINSKNKLPDLFEEKKFVDKLKFFTEFYKLDSKDNEAEVLFQIDQDGGRKIEAKWVEKYLKRSEHSKKNVLWMIEILIQKKKCIPVSLWQSLTEKGYENSVRSIISADTTKNFQMLLGEAFWNGCSEAIIQQMPSDTSMFKHEILKMALKWNVPEHLIIAMHEEMKDVKLDSRDFLEMMKNGYSEALLEGVLSELDSIDMNIMEFGLTQNYSSALFRKILNKAEKMQKRHLIQAMESGISEMEFKLLVDKITEPGFNSSTRFPLYSVMERYSIAMVEYMIAKGAAKSSRYAYKNLTTALALIYPEAMVKDFLNKVKVVSEQQYATAQRSGYSPEILALLNAKIKRH